MYKKDPYLKELKKEAMKFFEAKDVEEILTDYEELLKDAIEDGRIEEEVCSELGEPKKVIRSLVREEGNTAYRLRRSFFKRRMRFALGGVCLLIQILWLFRIFENGAGTFWGLMVIMPFSFFTLWLMVGEQEIEGWQTKDAQKGNWLQWGLHGLCAVVSIFVFIRMRYQVPDWILNGYPSGIQIEYMGPALSSLLFGCCIVLAVIAAISIFMFGQRKSEWMCVVYHAVGSIFAIAGYRMVLAHMSELNGYENAISKSALLYIEAVGFVLVWWMWNKRVRSAVHQKWSRQG